MKMLYLSLIIVVNLKTEEEAICSRIKTEFKDFDFVQVDPLSPEATFHLSLTRTLYIKDYQKDLFKQKIIETLKSTELPTKLKCEKVEIYLNDEMTRTFIAIDVKNDERILKVIESIDKILKDFGLPVYYKAPKLHFSLFWCQGNEIENLNKKKVLSCNFFEEFEVKIEEIFIKCGNKVSRI